MKFSSKKHLSISGLLDKSPVEVSGHELKCMQMCTYNLLACVSICDSVVILDVAHDHRLYIYYTLLKYLTSDIHMHMIYYIIYLIFANNSHVVHSHAQVEHPHQTQ
jgi:hypothetical protein